MSSSRVLSRDRIKAARTWTPSAVSLNVAFPCVSSPGPDPLHFGIPPPQFHLLLLKLLLRRKDFVRLVVQNRTRHADTDLVASAEEVRRLVMNHTRPVVRVLHRLGQLTSLHHTKLLLAACGISDHACCWRHASVAPSCSFRPKASSLETNTSYILHFITRAPPPH